MPTSGALTIGVNAVPPIPPRLEIVKQPPCMSFAVNLPARAFAEISISSREISLTPFLSTSRTTGTTRPFGVSTAIPTCTYFFRMMLSPSWLNDELNCGYVTNADATAFMMNTSGVIFKSDFCFLSISFCSLRNASKDVMSASSN